MRQFGNVYYTHSDCNFNDVKRWKIGKEAGSEDAKTLKGKSSFFGWLSSH